MCEQYFVMRISSKRIREKKNKEQEIEKEFQQDFLRQKYIFTNAGYELTDENTFQDRITGGSKAEERPEFSRLLTLLREGDTCYFCSVDRFSRDYKNGMEMIDMLLYDKKVNIAFVGDNKVLYAGKRFDPNEWFYISMMLLTAEYQKRCIGQMTSQKLQAMKEQGVTLGKPITKLDPATVSNIHTLYESGVDITNISRQLGLGRKIVKRVVEKGE